MASRSTSFMFHAAGLSTVLGGRRPGWGDLYPVVDNPVEYRSALGRVPRQEGVARVRTPRARAGRHVGTDRWRSPHLLPGLAAPHQASRDAQQHHDAGRLRRDHPRAHRNQATHRDRNQTQHRDGNQDLPGVRHRPGVARRGARAESHARSETHRREGPAPPPSQRELRPQTESPLHV